MSNFSSLEEQISFNLDIFKIKNYGQYSLYGKIGFIEGFTPRVDNVNLGDCVVLDEDKEQVKLDELPESTKNEIIKDFI